FDVTYGEFGFVDPTHVKFKVSADSDEPATRYVWRGRDIEATAETIQVTASLIDRIGKVPDFVKLDLRAVENSVGFGSYNLLEATVTNLLDSYQTATVLLSAVNELKIENNTPRIFTLTPKASKKAYWLVRVQENLDPRYTYTFPIGIFSLKNTSSMMSFEAKENAPVFPKEVMQNIIDQSEREVQKIYSKKVAVYCSQDKEFYYVYDEPRISCSVKNSGNVLLRNLRVCLEQDCRTVHLGINQELLFNFHIKKPLSGEKKLAFIVENDAVSKATFYDLEVLDEPKIEIANLEFPTEISYDEPYQISFVLKKKSQSEPTNVHATVNGAGLTQTFDAEQLAADRKFIIKLDSGELSVKPNMFTINITYQDKNSKEYSSHEELKIKLINVTIAQRVFVFFKDAEKKLRNLFK
ncbi:hypothetical protein HZB03_01680, partial [Candidatus Woesearchaeota archaeon]|nr:hypothetical protein [Candidatus Woesearchaeota archaeon]